MKLLIFLGNYGKEYLHTRHNIGFMIGERVSEKLSATAWAKKNNYLFSLTENARLIKPRTYMNLSGEVFNWLTLDNRAELLIVADDTALPLGKLRFRENGTCGGHNGLRSIENALGDNNYPRLRIGVGNADFTVTGDKLADYVLANFNQTEKPLLGAIIENAANAVIDWINYDIKICQEKYNGENNG